MDIRNRILRLELVKASELLDHDGNPRSHPVSQRNFLRGMLEEVGIAGALVAYHSAKRDGKLTLIDGHLRKSEHSGQWPVLVTDLTDEEADKMLLGDFIGSYAEIDDGAMTKLVESLSLGDAELRVMLDDLSDSAAAEIKDEAKASSTTAAEVTVPDMELRPFEHYDYVLLLCRNSMDWNYLVLALGIERVNSAVAGAKNPKIGLARAVDARRVIDLLEKKNAK